MAKLCSGSSTNSHMHNELLGRLDYQVFEKQLNAHYCLETKLISQNVFCQTTHMGESADVSRVRALPSCTGDIMCNNSP